MFLQLEPHLESVELNPKCLRLVTLWPLGGTLFKILLVLHSRWLGETQTSHSGALVWVLPHPKLLNTNFWLSLVYPF